VILFKPEHVAPILSGRKTQTRRLGKKRWNVGAVHQCQTKMLRNDSVFAHVLITGVWRQCLSDMTDDEVYAEGYDSFPEYCRALWRINGGGSPDMELWVVTFQIQARAEEGSGNEQTR
jgi:hypothetical protein